MSLFANSLWLINPKDYLKYYYFLNNE